MLPSTMSPAHAIIADPSSPRIGLSLVLLLICAVAAWAMQRKTGSSGSDHEYSS